MRMQPALLEEWLRERYFAAGADLSSSGVQPWSYGELRELIGLDPGALDELVFADSESFGARPLRAAIAERWAGGDADRVFVTHGSSEGIFLVMQALLEPGDEVVAVEPAYHALVDVAVAAGARLRRWVLRPEDGFAPDLDRLAQLMTPATRMVIVNFPHNPTGVSLDEAGLARLVDLVAAHGSYLVWDGAFAELTYDAPPLPDPAGWYERAVSFGTLSKAHGLPGLRVGWCIADPAIFTKLLPLRDRMTLAISPLVEFVATRAVACADLLVAARLRQAAYNRDTLAGWAKRLTGLVDLPMGGGGVCVFPRIHVDDVDAFCQSLFERDGVLVVPGSCFGHSGHIRLGYGCATDDFDFGLARLADALVGAR
ncbi:capreomycidine synthase [Dactylosporangium sp. NPDC051484]|uniref:capreomycidine synthase n=1 Tax=Dactylosporangium sp. NPDC051484 TaxID=3154942 RepID=UPI0034507F9A